MVTRIEGKTGETERQTDTDSPILTADDVTHQFGTLSVLRNVSLSIQKGSVTAIIGPNGSGKTTLIRLLAEILTPTSGRVRLQATGERPLGYVPQEINFRPKMTVRETLQFYATLLSGDIDVEQMLQRVGLVNVGERRIDALSGGMLRLLGVAQAVLGEPPVVLLDEPTSSLDPRMTRHVHHVVDNIADVDTGVVLTTHDLYSAEYADRLVVLDDGKIVADGSPHDIKTKTDMDSLMEAFVELVGEDAVVQTGRAED